MSSGWDVEAFRIEHYGGEITGYALMDEGQRANVQSIIDNLERVGEAIGSWTDQVNARTKGATYIATFEREVPVTVAVEWAGQLALCPALLADACRKLLAADAALRAQVDGTAVIGGEDTCG